MEEEFSLDLQLAVNCIEVSRSLEFGLAEITETFICFVVVADANQVAWRFRTYVHEEEKRHCWDEWSGEDEAPIVKENQAEGEAEEDSTFSVNTRKPLWECD